MNHSGSNRLSGLTAALLTWIVCATSAVAQSAEQALPGSHAGRPLALTQTHYRLRAGERVPIVAEQETLEFLRTAKTRSAKIVEAEGRGLVVGPNASGDQVLLAASLRAKPGEHTVTVSAISADGEERTAAINVLLDPMQTVPSGYALPPVVLLNGYQAWNPLNNLLSTCPVSSTQPHSAGTFGPLESQLSLAGKAGTGQVYFFDNCVEDPNGPIEDLGNVLADVLALIKYDNGQLVPQVDLVAHSMGGLIVRSYLAGLQTDGTLSPPANPRVRKFIEIATPNFGSYLAAEATHSLIGLFVGTQTHELAPGSTFLQTLAGWNQRGDDLRGVDALAIIGNGGTWFGLSGTSLPNASDGVVSLTSGSLGFSRDPSRTRIVSNTCHIDWFCTGIADESSTTDNIVLSFLGGDQRWLSLGQTPNMDTYLSQYGGLYLGYRTASDQWMADLTQITFGGYPLANGDANDEFYYSEFVRGTTAPLQITSESLGTFACGSFTEPIGFYTSSKCKSGPIVSSVGPLMNGVSGWVVQSGESITVRGVGFGTQQCPTCQISVHPNIVLNVSSWSDQAITAFLPAFTTTGAIGLSVHTATGSDYITFMIAPLAPPTISLSPAQLNFAYTIGSAAPPSQSVGVSNSGGGTFTWSAAASVPWLTFSSAPGLLTVTANPTGLSTNTYTGTITITGVGASNSPQTVSVTLTVSPATTPAPTISLSANQATFTYPSGGAAPPPQTIAVSNWGGGTLSWSAATSNPWLSATPSGTAPSTLTISIIPTGLSAGTYNGAITLTAARATNSPQTISVTLTVSAVGPTVAVTSVTNAASSSPGPIAPGEIITIKGSGLGPATGVSFSVDPSTGMVDTTLAGTTVLFGSVAAPILYTSAGQINAIVPYEIAGQSKVVTQVQYQGVSTTVLLRVASAAPGLFTFNSTGTGPAAAVNQDGSFNGPSNPAADGSYVTLYFTGGGQTNAVGVTGSITGSVLKWLVQNVTATVGGQPGTVAFDGAAPTFVDGFLQLNLGLPSGVHGTVPVVVTVGGIASPATATVTVQ